MQITKKKLQAELADLTRQRNLASEMVLRFDGAMQAVENLIAYCDKPEETKEDA